MAPQRSSDKQRGGREFAIDTAVVAVTMLLLKVRGLITLPLIVKLLGMGAYGIWTQVIALASFAGAIVSLNLHISLVRFIAADRGRAAEVYSTLLVATIGLASFGGVLLALLSPVIGRTLIGGEDIDAYLHLGLALMLIGNLRNLNLNLYRATNHLFVRSAAELVNTLGELVGIYLVLRGSGGLLGVFTFMTIWQGSIVVFQTMHCLSITGLRAPLRSVLNDSVRYAAPLLPAALSMWALDRIDRFVIGHFRGAEAVGVYSANYALAGMLMLFQAPFQVTLLPKVAALWVNERATALRYINVANTIFLTFAIPFVVGLPVIAPALLTHLANRQIGAAAGLNTFLISGGILLWGVSIMQIQIFHGAKRPDVIGKVTIASALVNLLLNLALVPLMGVAGAALSTLLAYAATCGAFAWLSRDIAALDSPWAHYAGCVLSALVMGLFLWVLDPNGPRSVVAAVVGAGVLYFAVLFTLRLVFPSTIGRYRVKLAEALGRARPSH